MRLEGATLPELQARVLAEHGDAARIVAAEQVTVGGIRGFFAKRHVEVTVEVPVTELRQAPGERRRAAHRRDELSTRLGIAALLDEADEAEALLHGGMDAVPGGEPRGVSAPTTDPGTGLPSTHGRGTVPHGSERAAPNVAFDGRDGTAVAAARTTDAVSTATPDFARLMDELTFATAPVRSAPATVTAAPPAVAAAAETPASPDAPLAVTDGAPQLLSGAGDLVLLLGLPDDVHAAARSLAAQPGAPISYAIDAVGDRRAALAARAGGVEQSRSILVTCGLPAGSGTSERSAMVAQLGADQVWAVVHAGRKPADTARWVSGAAALTPLDAIAVVGVESTATPGTVLDLGLPIGWLVAASAGPQNPIAIG
ncbi:hypothetical protein CTB96_11755 [Cryobacterium arcticum]|uniref:Uncharacterized protein n=1 Tax=Cryobacterium arcticum TaxID=670052 RepID=A0A317ZLV4_9MICO|nr:hypothetical protein CTB96_11755 [Cryobacterium arcticum]